MSENNKESIETRERVLEAAGEVFAESGFEKATIREIVKRAGANLNAVNYYFRDKHGLYAALFEHAHQLVGGKDQEVFATIRRLPPVERLRAMIGHVLRGFILTKRASWKMRLMLREMLEPTGVLEAMVERFVRPRFDEMTAIVRELAPRGLSDLAVRMSATGIMAQCAHIAHHRFIVSRLVPELAYTAEGVEKIADHITSFSLAAVRNLPVEKVEEEVVE